MWFKSEFNDISFHRDLRSGLGLTAFKQVISQFISSKYPLERIGKLLSLEYGSGLTEQEREEGEYPVVGSNGLVGYHNEYLVEGPCIIVGRKGSAGEVTYFEQNTFPIDTTFYVKQKNDLYVQKFLYYLLKTLKLQRLALFKGV